MRFRLKLLSFFLLISTYAAYGAATCELPYFISPTQTQKFVREHQSNLVSYLQENDIPAFYRRIGNQKIPVVLLNEDTYPLLNQNLQDLYGQTIQLKPGLGNGHGMLLVGPRDFSHRTYWTPSMGPREQNIIGHHDSYIEVLDFASMVKNAKSTYAIFSYKMTPLENKFIDRYLKVRRAGLFHVPSGFDPQEPIPQAFQSLCTKGEKCYDYIAGTSVHGDSIAVMKYHLWEYFGKRADTNTIIQGSDIQNLIKEMQTTLDEIQLSRFLPLDLQSPVNLEEMEKILHPQMLDKIEYIQEIEKFLPSRTSHVTKVRTLNLLVGINTLEDYATTMQHMNLHRYNVWPDHVQGHDRLSAIFILHNKSYRPTAANYYRDVVMKFKNSTYENLFGANRHHLGDHNNWHTPLLNPKP